MAVGDFTIFNSAREDFIRGVHQFGVHDFKVAIVRPAAAGGIDPTAVTADPRWGAGGSTNLSTHQVATGTSYTNGGVSISSLTVTLSGAECFVAGNDINLPIDTLTGFTNGRWGILYNNTSTGKEAIGFIEGATSSSLINITNQGFSFVWDPSTAINKIVRMI